MRTSPLRPAALAAGLLLAGVPAMTSHAQTVAGCCYPGGSCAITTLYECNEAGGVWDRNRFYCQPETPSADPCVFPFPGIAMSQTAARRQIREDVVHSFWVDGQSHLNAMFGATPSDLFWQVWEKSVPREQNGPGAIIAPQIALIMHQDFLEVQGFDYTSFDTLTSSMVEFIVAEVTRHKEAFDAQHQTSNARFNWALRIESLSTGHDWELGPGKLPCFSNHADDLPQDAPNRKLPRQNYVSQSGLIISAGTDGQGRQTLVIANSNYSTTFFAQFPDDYYTLYASPSLPAATITINGESRSVVAFESLNSKLTVDQPFTVTPQYEDEFTIARGEPGADGGLWPCYFFQHGGDEVLEFMEMFCEKMAWAMDVENNPESVWPAGVGAPAAVVIGDEDFNLSGVDYTNYWNDYYYMRDRAADADYEIIEGVTLADWHAAHALDSCGDPLVEADFIHFNPVYSPVNNDARSYLQLTLQTAYNYHRERSTWAPLRAIWPRTHLSQYILGKGYGVLDPNPTDCEQPKGVPTEPDVKGIHGTAEWKGNVAWDAYYCMTLPYAEAEVGPDGGVNPVIRRAALTFRGQVAGASGAQPYYLAVQPSTELNAVMTAWFNQPSIDLFVQLTDGPPQDHPNQNVLFKVVDWDGPNAVFQLDLPLGFPVTTGESFVLYYPEFHTWDYLVNGRLWPTIETFCARYDQPIDEEGFQATAKAWATEQAFAQTRALPEAPYTVYYGPGPYDTLPEKVSFQAIYPRRESYPMEVDDGWLTGAYDWIALGAQARDYGVNDFVWYVPGFSQSPATSEVIFYAILGMQVDEVLLRDLYTEIACIADWDGNGILNHNDVKDYYTAYSNADPIADLNNDGEFTEADVTIFDQADDCGLETDCDGNMIPDSEEIAESPDVDPADGHPDVDQNENGRLDICEDCVADWCGDGVVGVSDIFCFLDDWFAQETQAYCLGGTCGVPAIFHFLGLWFAHGNGQPCVT